MSRVLAVYSEKGGVGKSALSAGLVAAARKRKLGVIAVDLDPRGTFTAELGISTDEAPASSMNDLLALDPQGESGLAADAFAEAHHLPLPGRPRRSVVEDPPRRHHRGGRGRVHRHRTPATGPRRTAPASTRTRRAATPTHPRAGRWSWRSWQAPPGMRWSPWSACADPTTGFCSTAPSPQLQRARTAAAYLPVDPAASLRIPGSNPFSLGP
ncbi:ParA family protein [Streptomyces mirabilis]|uniref:ParA family protein n=1 Tax=Streptomyces mirabilis TaxID=68239 RepID=UPI0036B607C4